MKNFARLLGLGSEQIEDKPQDVEINVEAEANINSSSIQHISVNEIVPNPYQPRKTFNDEALQDLCASIKEFGVIQPLLVRRTPIGYELVAGERRLRASKLAGLQVVPVIVKELDDKEMAELAMIENLQREDLHFLEEAEGFQQLITCFNFTQEELARRVGKNQSTIANKLRLLRLPSEVRNIIAVDNLTERHARALLKLDDPKLQKEILDVVREKGLNVRETDALIEGIAEDISREMSKKAVPKQNVIKIIKDVRIFINTINHVVGEMKKTGLNIKVDQQQDDDFITVNLRIPKRR